MLSIFSLVGFVFFVLVGHSAAALIVYFNHRFVFHGKLKRLPVLRQSAKMHAMQHRYAYADHDPYILVPLMINIVIIFSLLLVTLISIPLSLGIASFCFLYMYRHWAIHNTDFTSHFHKHHEYHHNGNVKSNYSGIYPLIDKIFGTYVEFIPKEDRRRRSK